jgi:hypothetical protein
VGEPTETFELEWIDRSGLLRAKATLIQDGPKAYRLIAGAVCVERETPTLPEAGRRRRREARAEGVLVESPTFRECLELTQDRVFKSLSGAAIFVLGMSAQGSAWWSPLSEAEPSSQNENPEQAALERQRILDTQERQRDEMKKFLTARPGYESVMQEFLSLVNSMLTSDEWKPACSVTSRIKSPESLMRKLTKRRDGISGEVRALDGISDIIGVRVIFYSREDVEEFNERLKSLRDEVQGEESKLEPGDEETIQGSRLAWVESIRSFLPTGNRIFQFKSEESRDERANSPGEESALTKSYYVARHWVWEYSEVLTLKGPDSRIMDVTSMPYTCELQVVYVFDHVVNEVLHDLIYKDDTRRRDGDARLGDNLSSLKEVLGSAERILQGKIIEYLQRGSTSASNVDLT